MNGLYLEVAGRGPDLVLLHGWGLNLRVWDDLVHELRDHFRVITVDLPGHGRSPWRAGRGTPAEQAWLIHQTVASVSRRYALLGWSLGGQLALDLAAAMPGEVERLVLVATTAKFASGPDWPRGMPGATIARLAAELRTDHRGTVSDFLELQARGSADAERVLERLRNALSDHGHAQPEALAAGLETLTNSDLRATLPYVRSPALVIAGQYDRITPPLASRALAKGLPDARYVELRRAAHAPFLSHGEQFALLVEKFLREPTTARGHPKGKSATGKSTAKITTRKSKTRQRVTRKSSKGASAKARSAKARSAKARSVKAASTNRKHTNRAGTKRHGKLARVRKRSRSR